MTTAMRDSVARNVTAICLPCAVPAAVAPADNEEDAHRKTRTVEVTDVNFAAEVGRKYGADAR